MRHDPARRPYRRDPARRRGAGEWRKRAATGSGARARRHACLQHLASAYGATALLVAGVVLLLSAAIWNELSGDQFRFDEPRHTASGRAGTQLASKQLARPPGSVSPGPRNDASPARSVGTTAGATTISGNALAVALIAAVHGIGLLVLRAVRRRREIPDSASGGSGSVEDEWPLQEPADESPLQEPGGDGPEAGPAAPHAVGVARDLGGLESGELVPTGAPAQAAAVSEAASDPRPELVPTMGWGLPEPQRIPESTPGTVSSRVVLFDRRLGQRVAFVSSARLQWPGHDVACTTVDLSMRGVGCDLARDPSEEPLPATGSDVWLTLILNGTLAVLRARVSWCRVEETAARLGLQFIKLRYDQEALLQGVVIAGPPA